MGKKEQQVIRIEQACRLLFTNNAASAPFAGRHRELPFLPNDHKLKMRLKTRVSTPHLLIESSDGNKRVTF
ncbi:MAG TPA: hypothetical protein VGI60_14800 [Chthoniobacterales bacterium]|jgi:hypothetical protein